MGSGLPPGSLLLLPSTRQGELDRKPIQGCQCRYIMHPLGLKSSVSAFFSVLALRTAKRKLKFISPHGLTPLGKSGVRLDPISTIAVTRWYSLVTRVFSVITSKRFLVSPVFTPSVTLRGPQPINVNFRKIAKIIPIVKMF